MISTLHFAPIHHIIVTPATTVLHAFLDHVRPLVLATDTMACDVTDMLVIRVVPPVACHAQGKLGPMTIVKLFVRIKRREDEFKGLLL
jgi:hypothetical protein